MIGRDFAGYRIEAQIGQGGIGVVYRARERERDRPVAIKLLRADAISRSQRSRFEREAKALAALSHPNVVTILDCGVSDSIPYLAMELLDGQSLAEALGGRPMPAERAQRVVTELVAALAYVHEQGLVHRDLKPHNVFLAKLPGGGERAKLLDFGLAKFLDPDAEDTTLTRTGEVFGTPAYMPPEQWSGDKVDARADVYSAAVVCFELLTGRRPFLGEGHELLRAQLIDLPPLVHEVCPGRAAQPALERALQRALAKRAHERQASAVELARALMGVPSPWVLDATPERCAAAATARDGLELATAATVEQRAEEEAAISEAITRVRLPEARPAVQTARRSAIREGLRRLSLLGAWTLSLASVLVIGVAATMIYLARTGDHPEARAALEQAVPPIRDAVAHAAGAAKHAVGEAVSASTEQVVDALPVQREPEDAAREATAAQAQAIPREAARNPWRVRTPRELRKPRARIEAGERGDKRLLAELRRYNREHPGDPRAHLLLARLFVNRGAWGEVVAQYELAHKRDASSRGDPRMLQDLVDAAAREASSERAIELIPAIYGPEALEEIAVARSRARTKDERARLDRLARAVPPR